jgi:hypothetical protein
VPFAACGRSVKTAAREDDCPRAFLPHDRPSHPLAAMQVAAPLPPPPAKRVE